ncbi:hypothetical protein HDA32_004326 [Spinactinospora alkalitolerans]|uniref:Uncharacterized protein n=1 Tax=Spinactinospora alkalitolerans TaxID=687207 RepID=A0A852TXH6_9ACTN|nr:hypothetical protein [Spinactinospora alkalitolerans]
MRVATVGAGLGGPAPAAAIRHDRETRAPVKRSLIAYGR